MFDIILNTFFGFLILVLIVFGTTSLYCVISKRKTGILIIIVTIGILLISYEIGNELLGF